MLLIATSISCATFNLAFLAIIILIATTGLFMAKFGGALVDSYLSSGMVTCTLPIKKDKQELIQKVINTLTQQLKGGRIDSITESDDHIIVSTNFHVLGSAELLQLQTTLVEIESQIKIDVFYNNQVS